MIKDTEISKLIYKKILSIKSNLIRDWVNPINTNTKH